MLQNLHKVNFTTVDGERVYFDSNGDSLARYELVNLQITARGIMEGETVGIYDASFPDEHQFIMNNLSLIWANDLLEVMTFFETAWMFFCLIHYNVIQLSLCLKGAYLGLQ